MAQDTGEQRGIRVPRVTHGHARAARRAAAKRGRAKPAGTTKIEGQKAVGITDQAHSGTLYVATTGKPYPVAVVQNGGGGGKLLFNAWDAPVTVQAPANAIDIEALERM